MANQRACRALRHRTRSWLGLTGTVGIRCVSPGINFLSPSPLTVQPTPANANTEMGLLIESGLTELAAFSQPQHGATPTVDHLRQFVITVDELSQVDAQSWPVDRYTPREADNRTPFNQSPLLHDSPATKDLTQRDATLFG
ncbi:hypothetical protein BaRGS_00020661, partial [Batillaria attramentaria]